MPALSDQEMAALNLSDLAHIKADHAADDDDEAVRSQLMANLEQSKFAHAANAVGINAPPRGIGEVNTKAVTAITRLEVNGSDATHRDNAELSSGPQSSAGNVSSSNADTVEGRDRTVEDSKDMPDAMDIDDPSGTEGTLHVQLGDQGQPRIKEQDQDQDDEEFEDASSTIEAARRDIGNAQQAQTESDVELGEATDDSGNSESSEEEDESDDGLDMCLFCDQKEPNDGLILEDLTCAVCRRPAHRNCAGSSEAIEQDTESWRCPTCAANRMSESPKERSSKPRHSAPRLVRDLLPVSRGVQKPGAHSIFAQPLIQDDDGGRSLRRKRNSPSSESQPRPGKRRKKSHGTPQPEVVDIEPISHSTRRSSQKLGSGLPPMPTARILQHRPFHKPPPHKFILAFRLDQSRIEGILSEPPRPSRRKYLKKKQKIPVPPVFLPPAPKFPALPTQHLIFPSMFGDRENDSNARPYGGILTESEAETSRSLPQMRDREVFEIARKEAEEERKKTSAKAEAEINGLNGHGANATNSKRTVSGPPSKIKCIQFGKHVIDTSYAAPYPEEYSHESRLFICEFCLKYLPSEFVAWRHKLKCPAKHPPGDEIYRDGSISIWEVDGRKKTEYCQCLCLMAKLFLGSKTLYYDVDPFLFYVLTEYDEYGYHFVGYFSKEKRPASQNNVSCILIMPIHQRKGYATFLIEFSYLLTRIEGKEGSPEKPLSDMGLTAYRSYWDLTISKHLLSLGDQPFSVRDFMARTGMTADDVVHSLERLYAFTKDPVTKTYAIRYNKTLYENTVEKYESKKFRQINPERLVWTPYIMGRSDAAILDAAPVTAVAQREEVVKVAEIEAEAEAGTGSDNISPKTSQEPGPKSPSDAMIDPVLLSEKGNIAPGPPPINAMNGVSHVSVEADQDEIMVNGIFDKGKAPADEPMSGYALTYKIEKIPATRFQIDPPIPPAMIRYAKSKRKSMTGTSRPGSTSKPKLSTPRAVRSSPRKPGSVISGSAGRTSRATTPEKGGSSIRRSNRRSALANEITNGDQSDEEEEDDVAVEDDGEDDGQGMAVNDEVAVENSEEESASEGETSGQSEGSAEDDEEEVVEQASASDDSDAIVDEDEEEEEDSDEDEGHAGIDIPSPSSAASSGDEGSEGTTED